jgi:hypothetical protein
VEVGALRPIAQDFRVPDMSDAGHLGRCVVQQALQRQRLPRDSAERGKRRLIIQQARNLVIDSGRLSGHGIGRFSAGPI